MSRQRDRAKAIQRRQWVRDYLARLNEPPARCETSNDPESVLHLGEGTGPG